MVRTEAIWSESSRICKSSSTYFRQLTRSDRRERTYGETNALSLYNGMRCDSIGCQRWRSSIRNGQAVRDHWDTGFHQFTGRRLQDSSITWGMHSGPYLRHNIVQWPDSPISAVPMPIFQIVTVPWIGLLDKLCFNAGNFSSREAQVCWFRVHDQMRTDSSPCNVCGATISIERCLKRFPGLRISRITYNHGSTYHSTSNWHWPVIGDSIQYLQQCSALRARVLGTTDWKPINNRLWLNVRKFNYLTIKDAHPLQNIESILSGVDENIFIGSVDLRPFAFCLLADRAGPQKSGIHSIHHTR